MRLRLYHPQWDRSCVDCMKYQYIGGSGPDAGTIRRNRFTRELELRPNPNATPCQECPKIPRSAPSKHRDYAIEMSEENQQAYDFYRRCKGTGRFPPDEIVEWYAGIIRQIEDDHARNSIVGRLDSIAAMLGVMRVNNG